MDKDITKATGQVAEMVTAVTKFVDRIMGEPLEQIGTYLGDSIRFRRYKNLLKIQDKVDAINGRRRREGKPVPIPARNAIPLIETSSLEDDDSLQDLWANLIANATDDAKHFVLQRMHINIIGEFEPLDARILKVFAEWPSQPMRRPHFGVTREDVIEHLGLKGRFQEYRAVGLSLDNLTRLKCLRLGPGEITHPDAGRIKVNLYRLTRLGQSILVSTSDSDRLQSEPLYESENEGESNIVSDHYYPNSTRSKIGE